jgi:hypothetical protein
MALIAAMYLVPTATLVTWVVLREVGSSTLPGPDASTPIRTTVSALTSAETEQFAAVAPVPVVPTPPAAEASLAGQSTVTPAIPVPSSGTAQLSDLDAVIASRTRDLAARTAEEDQLQSQIYEPSQEIEGANQRSSQLHGQTVLAKKTKLAAQHITPVFARQTFGYMPYREVGGDGNEYSVFRTLPERRSGACGICLLNRLVGWLNVQHYQRGPSLPHAIPN